MSFPCLSAAAACDARILSPALRRAQNKGGCAFRATEEIFEPSELHLFPL